MIKAENLRIGDLVRVSRDVSGLCCGDIGKITIVGDYFIQLTTYPNRIERRYRVFSDDIEGIPITPKILELNGFGTVYSGKCYNRSIGGQKRFLSRHLSIEYGQMEWKVFIKYASLIDHVLLRSVNYVHELQHILWALGEDANIKI